MTTYIIKRLLLMIPTLFGVSIVVWAVLTSAPEKPITSSGPGSAEEGKSAGEAGGVSQSVKIFRAQYGLDKPAVLNRYYSLDLEDVREAVALVASEPTPENLRARNQAQEQLVKWDWYAAPSLLQLVQQDSGEVRDHAMSWLVRTAERVAVGTDTGRIDAETVRSNTLYVKEGEILRLLRWNSDDPEERKAAGVAGFTRWYEGLAGRFPAGPGKDAVRAAITGADGAALESWGAAAVPALVSIVLEDGGLRDRAIGWLARGAKERPGADDLERGVAGILEWHPEDPPARKQAGVDLVRVWWHGAQGYWDYSGGGWLRVLFLETRFAKYWGNLLSFDLGYSSVHKIPVIELILSKLKYSLTLACTSLLLAYLISIPLGFYSARFHKRADERIVGILLFALYSAPSFFVATLVVRFFAYDQPDSAWELIPDKGFEDVNAWRLTTWYQIKDIAWHIAAPIGCMTYASFAALSRYAKSGLLDVINSDYVRTARAMGNSELTVTLKHAGRNGVMPVVTLLGATLPRIVGGSFIIEWIFSIPGFGLLTIQSINNQDYNVIIGTTLVVATLTMIGLLLSDLLYAILDPRISYQ